MKKIPFGEKSNLTIDKEPIIDALNYLDNNYM